MVGMWLYRADPEHLPTIPLSEHLQLGQNGGSSPAIPSRIQAFTLLVSCQTLTVNYQRVLLAYSCSPWAHSTCLSGSMAFFGNKSAAAGNSNDLGRDSLKILERK